MRWIFIYLTLFLGACGGGGGSGGSAPNIDTVATVPAPPPQPEPGYTISGVLTGLNSIRDIELKVNDQSLLVKSDGNFSFNNKLQTGTEYEVEVERESARQDCEITNEKGTIDLENISNVRVVCEDEKNLSLFSLDTLNKIRLTMTLEEWSALVLDTSRSNYSIRNASGPAGFALSSWTHSEVYRQADFDFIDDEGMVVESIEKVAFKMQGNTSRQFPVDDSAEVAGTGQSIPQRFSFSIKFDEEFEDDESVYSCIDSNGNPAAVDNNSCFKIVGQDIPEYKEADGREFRDFEKLRFRYNRDDPTYQREVLAHEILNQIGVPTARATHISIEFVITGKDDQTLFNQSLPQTYDMGVFIMVEQIDKPFLKSYFDKNGYLFKVGVGNLSGLDVVDEDCIPYEDSEQFFNNDFCIIGVEKSDPESREEWLGTENYQDPDFVNSAINKEGNAGNISQFVPYQPSYDLKTKKKSLKEARAELISFAKFVQTYPTPEQLATRFDVEGFIKAQAAEIVLGAVDHYVRVANNYYLYFNEPSNKWVYIPTDFDFTLIDIPSINCEIEPDHLLCNTGFLNFNKAFRDIIQTRAFPTNEPESLSGYPDWAGRPLYPTGIPLLWTLIFSNTANQNRLYQEMQSILDNQFDWHGSIGSTLDSRDKRIRSSILSTEASLGGLLTSCELVYNSEEIAGNESLFCDKTKASIKRFIEEHSAVLQEEINLKSN